jgi:hypothetical protein
MYFFSGDSAVLRRYIAKWGVLTQRLPFDSRCDLMYRGLPILGKKPIQEEFRGIWIRRAVVRLDTSTESP